MTFGLEMEQGYSQKKTKKIYGKKIYKKTKETSHKKQKEASDNGNKCTNNLYSVEIYSVF